MLLCRIWSLCVKEYRHKYRTTTKTVLRFGPVNIGQRGRVYLLTGLYEKLQFRWNFPSSVVVLRNWWRWIMMLIISKKITYIWIKWNTFWTSILLFDVLETVSGKYDMMGWSKSMWCWSKIISYLFCIECLLLVNWWSNYLINSDVISDAVRLGTAAESSLTQETFCGTMHLRDYEAFMNCTVSRKVLRCLTLTRIL